MSNKIKVLAALALVAIGALAAFSPALKADFTNWDDDRLVVNNPVIRGFTGANLKAIFGYAYCGTYIPLTLISFATDYQLYGLKPAGYHFTNILFHILNALLAFGLFFMLTRDPGVAFFVGILFAVHPLRAESVAWVTERKDVLFVFFYFLALYSYVRHARKPSWIFYILSFISFLLSGLAKGAALSLPIVLILTDWFLGRKYKTRLVWEKIPFVAAAIVFGLLAVYAQRTLHSAQIPIVKRFFTANWVAAFYLVKTLIPVRLSALYPYPAGYPETLPLAFLLAPFVTGILAFFSGYSLPFTKKFVFGLLFFLVTLLPVSQLVTVAGPEIAANRYTYLPLVGIFYLAGVGGVWLWRRIRSAAAFRFILASAGCVLILGLIWLSWGRSQTWHDSISLWTDVLRSNPRIPEAYNNRGAVYAGLGQYDRALADYERALAIDPDFSRALNNRGTAFQRIGDFEKARADFDQAINLDPANPDLRYNRGNLFMAMENYDLAIRDYTAAVTLRPAHLEAWNNRGNAYCRNGDYDRGIADYDRVLSADPEYIEAYNNRAVAFFLKKDYDRAWQDVNKLRALGYPVKPDFLNDLQRMSGRDR